MSKRARPQAQGPSEMKRTKSQEKPGGSKRLVDILPFGAAFHDDARQKLARKQNWLLGTSALGEKYAEYENKVWADLRARRRFDLSPDELTKAVPSLADLDKDTHKDLWVQYKRHCVYEQGAKALVDEVAMQRDHLQAQMTNLEASLTDQEKMRNDHMKSLQQRLQEAHNQLANCKETSQIRAEDLQAENKKLAEELEAARKSITEKDELLRKASEEKLEQEDSQELISSANAQKIASLEAENARLQGKVDEGLALITSERAASEKLQEKLDAENQELVEQLAIERRRLHDTAESMREEKEELEEDLEKEREKHNIKVSNSNKIYEQNAMLEKQLAIKMEKIEKLTQMNEALQNKVAAVSMLGNSRGNSRDDDSAMPSLSANERAQLLQLLGKADQNQPKKAPASSGNWLQNLGF